MQNNVWRKPASGTSRQCLKHGPSGSVGWDWVFPWCDEEMYAFPAAVAGISPFLAMKPTVPVLNTWAGAYKNLDLSYNIELKDAVGSYNTVIKGYALSVKNEAAASKPENVRMEIKWYLTQQGTSPHFGDTTWEVVEAGDRTWDAWVDTSRSSYPAASFVPRTPPCESIVGGLGCTEKLNVKSFLTFLYQRGFIAFEDWFQGIEIGTEVYGDCAEGEERVGRGKVMVTKFDVGAEASYTVRPKPGPAKLAPIKPPSALPTTTV